MDSRAQSIGIARMFLGLLVGAAVFWIMNEIASPILDRAGNTTSNATANQATQWFQDGVEWFPIFVLLASTMGLVVYAIYVREIKR